MHSVYCVGPPSPLNAIRNNKIICLSSSTTLSWDPFTSDPVCGPVSYDVTISPSDGVMMMRITNTSYNFTGLQFGTNYTVTVAGRNNAGAGESSMITFYKPTMEEAVPSGESVITRQWIFTARTLSYHGDYYC